MAFSRSRSFDIVTCTVSFDYLNKPLEADHVRFAPLAVSDFGR